MKLYATITGTGSNKSASKGSDEQLHIELKRGNKYIAHIYMTPETLIIERNNKREVIHLGTDKGEMRKGEREKLNGIMPDIFPDK